MWHYASFFEWYDKGTKEFGVVETVVEALAQAGLRQAPAHRQH